VGRSPSQSAACDVRVLVGSIDFDGSGSNVGRMNVLMNETNEQRNVCVLRRTRGVINYRTKLHVYDSTRCQSLGNNMNTQRSSLALDTLVSHPLFLVHFSFSRRTFTLSLSPSVSVSLPLSLSLSLSLPLSLSHSLSHPLSLSHSRSPVMNSFTRPSACRVDTSEKRSSTRVRTRRRTLASELGYSAIRREHRRAPSRRRTWHPPCTRQRKA